MKIVAGEGQKSENLGGPAEGGSGGGGPVEGCPAEGGPWEVGRKEKMGFWSWGLGFGRRKEWAKVKNMAQFSLGPNSI